MQELEKPTFNPNDWEPCIATEEGEVACCERCKTISDSGKKGEHLFCKKCLKYIWREKCQKK